MSPETLSLLHLICAIKPPTFNLATSQYHQTIRNRPSPPVNAEGNGLVAISIYTNGALGSLQAQQPQLVLDGVADSLEAGEENGGALAAYGAGEAEEVAESA